MIYRAPGEYNISCIFLVHVAQQVHCAINLYQTLYISKNEQTDVHVYCTYNQFHHGNAETIVHICCFWSYLAFVEIQGQAFGGVLSSGCSVLLLTTGLDQVSS